MYENEAQQTTPDGSAARLAMAGSRRSSGGGRSRESDAGNRGESPRSAGPNRGRTVVDDDLERELAAVAESAGCELVHAEFAGGTLRLFIDRPEGVGISDCQLVSKQVSALLDVLDFGSSRYLLEVSSPGLDRQLYRARDYERFVGRKVKVSFFGSEGKQTVVGVLEAFDPDHGGQATVASDQETLRIPLADISVARLEVEL